MSMNKKAMIMFLLRMLFGLIVLITLSTCISDKVGRLFVTRDFAEFERLQNKINELASNDFELTSTMIGLREDTAIYGFPKNSDGIFPAFRDGSALFPDKILRPDTCPIDKACLCICVDFSASLECGRGSCNVFENVDFTQTYVRGEPQGGFILERFEFTDVKGPIGNRMPAKYRTAYIRKYTPPHGIYVTACFDMPFDKPCFPQTI